MIQTEAWAKQTFDKIKERTDKYISLTAKDPDWLLSRLQMYWNTHATDVYIRGEVFASAGGSKAPVPTVRFTGARAANTIYGRPKLEDITPFMDDERGLWLPNNSRPGQPFEWAEPSKTGTIIQSINREVMSIARDAAFVYWITGDEKYATLARGIFDTYMTGMYYRNVPIDLNNGHQQTLVSLSSFEVIHEDIITELVPLYDFLHEDLLKNKATNMDIYGATFKKWADNLIQNGVPHNNWDLFKSNFILSIALVLDDNTAYKDGKGRQYYIDYVLNKSSIRQWSLPRLMDYGFDKKTGIWAECPGYSVNVVGDFANFISWFDGNFNYDLLPQFPVITKAVSAIPRYLFPSMNTIGFGDTHPGHVRTDLYERMIANAQRYGKREQEVLFTKLLKMFEPQYGNDEKPKAVKAEVTSFFKNKPLKLDPTIPVGKLDDFVSSTFWAPNVSWFTQRNGNDPQHSLMISENASEGNHMHANGISMEIYGKGYTLAPDMGIGSGYFALDYAEYYGQFPAHNTVCVNGISSYPIMKSNHAFELRNCYPVPESNTGNYNNISYSDVYFREPESCADQTRLLSIVTTGKEAGYYVDIFRSKKVDGNDKMHDYFYHNLGQKMTITDTNGDSLNLKPTEELAFAGAHLYAYSYLFNKKSAVTGKDVKVTFTMARPNGDDIYMNMWMKGEKDREIFSALAPMCEGLSRTPGMPYNVKETPTLTYVARQNGEAWTRPFVSVFEPASKNEPSNIASVSFFAAENVSRDFVGIKVESKNGRMDYIFSNSNATDKSIYNGMSAQSTYSIISAEKSGDCVLFMGNGTLLTNKEVKIETKQAGNVCVEKKDGNWFYTAGADCKITIKGKCYKLPASGYKAIVKL
ncbi:MAG TPA: heparinase II/III family protein [Paludibacter sp.]|nr:heparinase II/III family protein [Paludibacter sp.]